MKKLMSILVTLTMVLGMGTSVFANSEEAELMAEPDYYQEKGQIDLQNLKLELNDDREIIVVGQDGLEKKEFLREIEKSENLQEALKNGIEKEETPIAVGYTRVYLKEIKDASGTHVEPLAASEEISGSKEKRGNLTLYTTAFATTQGITVKSIAQWSNNFQLSQKNTPAEYEDYISAATSNKYILNSSKFAATMTNGYALNSKFYNKRDEGTASVVYSFKEMGENAYSVKKATVTIHCGKNGTLPSTIKSISKYVHTWGSANIGISFSATGPNFSISSSQKAWQIASSVNVPKK